MQRLGDAPTEWVHALWGDAGTFDPIAEVEFARSGVHGDRQEAQSSGVLQGWRPRGLSRRQWCVAVHDAGRERAEVLVNKARINELSDKVRPTLYE